MIFSVLLQLQKEDFMIYFECQILQALSLLPISNFYLQINYSLNSYCYLALMAHKLNLHLASLNLPQKFYLVNKCLLKKLLKEKTTTFCFNFIFVSIYPYFYFSLAY